MTSRVRRRRRSFPGRDCCATLTVDRREGGVMTVHEEAQAPASFRAIGDGTGWVREPLDDAVGGRRQVIAPPAAATLGTPAHSGAKAAQRAEMDEPGTVFMMGDNPALPK